MNLTLKTIACGVAAMGIISFTAYAEPIFSSLQTKGHHHSSDCESSSSDCSSSSSDCGSSSDALLARVDAIQQSIDVIGTFALRLSAAIRETDPDEQVRLVRELRRTLAPHFNLTFVFPMDEFTANDFATLLEFVQNQSALASFDANLIGDFSVEHYHRNSHGNRKVQLHALQYDVQTLIAGQSTLNAAVDKFTVVETKCGEFKIKTLESTVIGEIPMGSAT